MRASVRAYVCACVRACVCVCVPGACVYNSTFRFSEILVDPNVRLCDMCFELMCVCPCACVSPTIHSEIHVNKCVIQL